MHNNLLKGRQQRNLTGALTIVSDKRFNLQTFLRVAGRREYFDQGRGTSGGPPAAL